MLEVTLREIKAKAKIEAAFPVLKAKAAGK
jgi:hypothetical protein